MDSFERGSGLAVPVGAAGGVRGQEDQEMVASALHGAAHGGDLEVQLVQNTATLLLQARDSCYKEPGWTEANWRHSVSLAEGWKKRTVSPQCSLLTFSHHLSKGQRQTLHDPPCQLT